MSSTVGLLTDWQYWAVINGDVDLISVKNHITLRKLRAVVGLSSSLKAFALLAVYVYLVGRITVGHGITAARRPDTPL